MSDSEHTHLPSSDVDDDAQDDSYSLHEPPIYESNSKDIELHFEQQPDDDNDDSASLSSQIDKKELNASRLLTTWAVAWHVYSVPIITSTFLLACAFPPFWPLVFAYLIYMFVDKGPENGSGPNRSSYLFRSSPLWKYFAEYFSMVLHKTCELEPAFALPELADERGIDEDDVFSDDPEVETETIVDGKADSTGIEVVQTAALKKPKYQKKSKKNNKSSKRSKSIDYQVSPDTTVCVHPNDNTESPLKGLDFENRQAGDEENDSCIIESSTKFADSDSHHGYFGLRKLVHDIIFWIKNYYVHRREPLRTVRTGKQYIFGYHPHGIIGMGSVGAIATEGTNWSKMFPGVPVTTLTLVNQFQIPLHRDYLLSLGLASVSKRSCKSLLSRGQSICILLGGAQESLLARPGNMDLVLRKRQGFIKLAMSVPGTEIVPIIAFGENNLYDQVKNDPNTRLYKIQTFLKGKLGYTLPLIHGRGIFNYDFGIIPYPRPVNIVVGKPIEVPASENPDPKEVEQVHRNYMKQVRQLFDSHKDRFHNSGGMIDGIDYQDLRFIE